MEDPDDLFCRALKYPSRLKATITDDHLKLQEDSKPPEHALSCKTHVSFVSDDDQHALALGSRIKEINLEVA